MGVALYTTLALVTGVLIAVQYYNLESGCEELFSVLNQISEVSIDKVCDMSYSGRRLRTDPFTDLLFNILLSFTLLMFGNYIHEPYS